MAVKRGLVVDDSKAARTMLKKLLEKNGLEIETAESGEDALSYLTQNHPDVIFMDHMMPGMDGLETTKAITSNPDTAMIPVVMFTSKEGDEYKENARSHGAVGFLNKPPKPDHVAEVIQELGGLKAGTDAATVPAAPAQQAATPATAEQSKETMDKPVSADWVKDIARNEAETIAKRVVEALTEERWQAWSTQFKKDADRMVEEQLGEQLTNSLDNFQTHQERHMQAVLHEGVDKAIQAKMEPLIESSVTKHVDHQMISHIGEIQHKVQEQIDVIRQSVPKAPTIDPSILDEIKTLAKTSAVNAAQHAAQAAAEKAAHATAQTLITKQLEQERSRLDNQISSLKSSVNAMLFKAIIIGLVAGAGAGAAISFLL